MTRPCRRKRNAESRAYTIVELMVAITVFAIGITGIIALQQVTVVANKHARNLATATHIASAWLDQLNLDAGLWNGGGMTNTAWLNTGVGLGGVWFRPAWVAGRTFGAAFDLFGEPMPDSAANQAAYCANLAITRLYPSTNANGLVRAEVRVFWPKEGADPGLEHPFCNPNVAASDISDAGTTRFHFVHVVSAVRQTP